MKKQLLIIGIAALLILVVGLSGCNEQETSGDTDKVEIVSYGVETWGAYPDTFKKVGDGFIFDEYSKKGYYKISGIVKNIADKMLDKITITAKFYDGNNNYLKKQTASISNLANSDTAYFQLFYRHNESYFENVNSVRFEISAS